MLLTIRSEERRVGKECKQMDFRIGEQLNEVKQALQELVMGLETHNE